MKKVDDKNYWEYYYAQQNSERLPSLFAQYVYTLTDNRKDLKIIELGCGNGRDSVFFAQNGLCVEAVDQCDTEIAYLQSEYKNIPNLKFKCNDFSSLDNLNTYDIVYSRFTLHSVSEAQEMKTLEWAFNNLVHSGMLCVEVRGTKNEICGLGTPVEDEKNAFIYDNHYRRFIDFDTFCHQLSRLGFTITYAEEKKGFAPFKGTDETFIRVIAKK